MAGDDITGCLGGSCLVFIALPALVLGIFSFQTLQPIECACDSFPLLHPRLYIALMTQLSCRQYRYMPDHLLTLYLTYKGEVLDLMFHSTSLRFLPTTHARALRSTMIYSASLDKLLPSSIANVACNYSAYTFFNDKQGIARVMQAALSRIFREQLYANVEALQINQVDLPNSFQEAILESISTKQNITRSRRYLDNMQAITSMP
ncbi:MAG: hypothetical protein SGPRY_004549 [Prymnesium sp.]